MTVSDGMKMLLAAVVLAAAPAAAPRAAFDEDFTGAVMRVDLYHGGTAEEEHVSLDRVRIEGAWPGSRTILIDPTGMGKYLVEMVDRETGRQLYTRGFASIYGEWETTSEAAHTFRTIPEAVRVPEPRRPVQLRLRKRSEDGTFREIWSASIDPGSRFVDRPPPVARDVWTVFEGGDPATHVDLLVLGDGYAAEELPRFRDEVRELMQALFELEPFASRRGDFNVRAIDTAAPQSGVARPRAGKFRASPLGARYNTFDSERYVLTLEDRAWRDVAAAAPYDAVLILVNERQYGGGGIYNLYATAAAGSGFRSYLAIHEFGHSFAGLGDEYYTSSVAYEAPPGPVPEPWEPNVTADPTAAKWRALLSPGVPLPTPWGKREYEEQSYAFQGQRRELREAGAPEERIEELFREEREIFTRMLSEERYAGEVGAFEGAGYRQTGLYRPSTDCIMFTRDRVGFCSVCRAAIARVIDLHTR